MLSGEQKEQCNLPSERAEFHACDHFALTTMFITSFMTQCTAKHVFEIEQRALFAATCNTGGDTYANDKYQCWASLDASLKCHENSLSAGRNGLHDPMVLWGIFPLPDPKSTSTLLLPSPITAKY